jgi:hypothetical protein
VTNIKLDHSGLAAISKSPEMRKLVTDTANRIAEEVDKQNIEVGAFKGAGEIALPVSVRNETTDRATATVVLAHPAGIAVEAKHGALTKAASAVGLEVRS